MRTAPRHHAGPSPRSLRLETLSRLRWIAIAGQGLTVLAVAWVLDFEFPLGFCLALIALSCWLNMLLRLRFSAAQRLSPRASMALLTYDVLQLGGLLYLTGGLTNPFSLLFIVPVTVSASALAPLATIALGALTLVVAALLGIWHWPLPWFSGGDLALPSLYVAGVWFGLAACIAFISIYAWRISAEAMSLASALAATELALAREYHLSALDGLAAATAHELGTPLATIHLVATELGKDLPSDSPYADDIALLETQSRRCREILSKLSSLGATGDSPLEQVALPVLVDEIVGPHQGFGIAFEIMSDGDGPAPICRRDPAVLYGLGNIVENATDFAARGVAIMMRWNKSRIEITIDDDGPGFPAAILDKLGDPYIGRRARQAENGDDDHGKGLGLGVFIAKTLLERTGATMRFTNNADGGALVRVSWPRAALQIAAPKPSRSKP